MKHDRATEDIRELAALYALGSLTQHEARSFEIHIQEGCSVCEAEVHRFVRTLAELGFAAEEVPPPEYLRDLLIARIEREKKPVPPTPPPSEKKEERDESTASRTVAPPAPPLFSSQPRRESSNVLSWILFVLLLALAAAMFLSWKTSEGTIHRLQANLSAAQTDLTEMQKKMDVANERAADLEQIWVILNRQGTRMARLIGQPTAPSNVGAIFWDTQQSECLALGTFEAPPEGKVYQLWFFSATAKIPIGFLKTDSKGRFFIKFVVPREAEGATAVVVTQEPDTGSKIPTAPYCAAGRIE